MATSNSVASSVIYDSAKRGSIALEELRGIIQYRDLIYQLVRRDVVARYKRSVLGVAWTMLQPLGMMVILSIVFSHLFHQVQGYPAYVLSGLIAWTFFSQTTTAAIIQLVWGSAMFNKIYMPRTAFTVSAVGTGMVNLGLSLVPLILIVLLVGLPITWSILFLPVSVFFLASFALGVSLILSTLTISFPDVAEMYEVAVLGWLYLTPVIYPKEVVLNTRFGFVLSLNPMYYLVQMFRMPIYDGVLPDLHTVLIGGGVAIVTLVIGWFYFSGKA
ncbi:MAG TPA: ABC transporter permease, partial [Anaerolineales bacterium]|nr:ABC transporter permease [Anaerolineales bacterium]